MELRGVSDPGFQKVGIPIWKDQDMGDELIFVHFINLILLGKPQKSFFNNGQAIKASSLTAITTFFYLLAISGRTFYFILRLP